MNPIRHTPPPPRRNFQSICLSIAIGIFALAGETRAADRPNNTSFESSGQKSHSADIRARGGPLELRLQVQSTRIRNQHPLYLKIGIKNIGRMKIPIHDAAFTDWNALNERLVHPGGNVFLEIVDSAGRRPWPNRSARPTSENPSDMPSDPDRVPVLAVEREKKAPQVAEWRRAGIGPAEIDKRLIKAWIAEHAPPANDSTAKEFWLAPDASTETVRPQGHPQSDGDFVPLTALFLPPGKYQISAVWRGAFESIDGNPSRTRSTRIYKIKTSPTSFEVVP